MFLGILQMTSCEGDYILMIKQIIKLTLVNIWVTYCTYIELPNNIDVFP